MVRRSAQLVLVWVIVVSTGLLFTLAQPGPAGQGWLDVLLLAILALSLIWAAGWGCWSWTWCVVRPGLALPAGACPSGR